MPLNYNTLITDMQQYMLRWDPPFIAQIPDLIEQGIIRIYNNAKDLGFETTIAPIALHGNQNLVNKPQGWRDTISINAVLAVGAYPASYLLPRTYEFCQLYWPVGSGTGIPKYYSDYIMAGQPLLGSYGAWYIVPTPPAQYDLNVIYTAIPEFDAMHAQNFLTQRYPNLLLFSCLLEAALYLNNEEKRNYYEMQYNKELEIINRINVDRSADRTIIRNNN
jgi:hypothetical protein